MANSFSVGSLIARWVFAVLLVIGTYNPSDYSYISWVFGSDNSFGPMMAIVGLVLLIGWIIYLSATFQSMGWLGIALGAALFACIVWLLVDLGWLSLSSPSAFSWVALIILSLVLALGISWSHIWRRLTGQIDVDEIEN